MKRWLSVVLVLAAVSGGCGEDDSAAGDGEGCTTDAQCKGDRICVDRKCVDPGEGGGVQSGNGGTAAAGQGGSGGAGGSDGTAGKAGSGPVDDPELEQACIKNCEARQNAGCSMNALSLDQCMAQCLVIDEQGFGYCLDEQTAQYACLASGGYSCVSGYAQPKSTCVSESQALSTCSQKTPCRRFCERAAGSCAPAGEECVTACLADQSSFEDAICGVYYQQLLACWGTNLTCNGDIPAVGTCAAQAAEVADCIARRHDECDGFCYAAELLGCGSDDCLTTCRAKLNESSCGHYYRNYLDCSYSSNEFRMECKDGAPAITSECSTYEQQYTSCMPSM